MAFKIGKKNAAPADDWSDSALGTDAGSTPGPVDPADTFGTGSAAAVAPARKSLSPILLAAGAVLLLTAVGLGVYFKFLNKPIEEAAAPVVVKTPDAPPVTPQTQPPGAKPPSPRPAPAKKTVRVVQAPGKPAADPHKIVVTPAPNVAVKVKPGRAGLIPPGTKTPAVQSQPGKPAAAVPKPDLPRPIPIMRDGVAGQDGKGLPPASAVPVVHPTPAVSPALKAQLKTLWQQGAAAKHRGDKAAARRAWQKILQLSPGHPGIQEAIDKL